MFTPLLSYCRDVIVGETLTLSPLCLWWFATLQLPIITSFVLLVNIDKEHIKMGAIIRRQNIP